MNAQLLHTDLHYHPDASRQESIRLGSLLFTKDADAAGQTCCIVAFYQGDPSAVLEAQRISASEFFSNVFTDFTGYVRYLATQTVASPEMSEEQVALSFISILPHNLKAGHPEPWPPSRVFTQAAVERQPISAFSIPNSRATACL